MCLLARRNLPQVIASGKIHNGKHIYIFKLESENRLT